MDEDINKEAQARIEKKEKQRIRTYIRLYFPRGWKNDVEGFLLTKFNRLDLQRLSWS